LNYEREFFWVLKWELQSGFWILRENLGFKVGVAECFLEFEIEFGLQSGRAEWVLEFEREFGFQRESCRVGFGI
jgi:hypothetical protein